MEKALSHCLPPVFSYPTKITSIIFTFSYTPHTLVLQTSVYPFSITFRIFVLSQYSLTIIYLIFFKIDCQWILFFFSLYIGFSTNTHEIKTLMDFPL